MTCLRRICSGPAPSAREAATYLELARAQHLTTHQPRVTHPPDDREGDQHVQQARPEHGHERDRQQETGKRQQRINHTTDHVVPHAAEVAGHRAENRADSGGDTDHRDADHERDARPGQHAREDVAPELVQAERMRQRRPREPRRQILRGRIERRDRRPGNGRKRRDSDDDGPDGEERRTPTHTGSADQGSRTRRPR